MRETITVEKEVYEAVLRNSVRVNDLEAENHKLKEINLWHSEKLCDCEKENQQLKELLASAKDIIEWYSTESGYIDLPTKDVLTQIDNAIGEK